MKRIILLCGLLLLSSKNYTAQENNDITLYRESATMVNDLVHTKLAVSFNFNTQQLYGEEWVTVTPHFYPVSTLELDAKAMDIQEVKVENKNAPFVYKEDILTIQLGKTYLRGENYLVYIKYVANPEKVKQKGSAAINDAKGLYFIDPKDQDPEKPTQIWTQGETESSSCWFPTIDKPNQKTSQEISITVPDKYVTLSNGEMVSSKKNGEMRTDYWKFDKKHAPYLFFMGIGEYAVIKDKWRNIPVDYYVEKKYEAVAKDIFGLTPEMIEFFSQRLNYDFPWNKYSQMVARDYVSGAMENTTSVLFGEFVQQTKGKLADNNIAENVISHELFHHWFGDLVTCESWSNLTVNESLANYSEYLWLEHKYGKEKAEAHRFDEEKGYNNEANFSKNLVRFHYKSREDMFDGVSYNKGGLILHMLRNKLGDDAFFAGLHKYLVDNEYTAAEAHQLRLAFESVSGMDLNPFFNQWYYGNGHPKLKINYDLTQTGTVKVLIEQTQEPLFSFPLQFAVYEENTPKMYEVNITPQKVNEVTFSTSKPPMLVNANSNYVLLCDIEDNKNLDQYLYQYNNGQEFGDRYYAIDYFLNAQNNDSKALTALINSFNDKNQALQLIALRNFDVSNRENLTTAIPTLEKIVHNPQTSNLVKAEVLSILAETHDSQYKELFMNNSGVVSNAVKSAAISGLMNIDEEAAQAVVSKLPEDEISNEIAILLIDNYIASNDTSKMKLFAENAPFYSFLAAQNPELGKKYQKAYQWIMESDNKDANDIIVKTFTQVLSQYAQYKTQIVTIINEGILYKKQGLDKQPKNETLKTQLKTLSDLTK